MRRDPVVSDNDPVLDALNHALPDLFRAIDLIGVLLNGIIGGRLARTKHFDAVGFAVLAIMSALAGGMLRDVLLQSGPPAALTDPHYLGTALVGAGIAMLWKLDSRPWRIALVIMDGIVLGCWAATGTLKTLQAGFGILPAIMLGVITAVGGGAIRDVSAGNIPQVFGGNNLYATPALVSSAIMVLFELRGLGTIGMLFATLVGSSFTVLSHWRGWQLPQVSEWELSFTSSQLRSLLGERSSSRPRLAIHDASPIPGQINDEDLPSSADERPASSDDSPSA
ncbi:trimeric intracellular cation channel family protein [Schaalia cardiffensis]|uniref:trimeric intracellular cation channel family protein n=1 Tax=Schaalia cardiffensis TaxID=181487 RepID=UPI0023F1C7C3|nr:trimeric intracellular cation channel family protein [Schaalia cardiffensis]